MRRQPTDNKTTEKKKKKSICTFITHSKCQNRSALSGRREYTEISCGVLVDLIIEWPVLSAPRNVYTMVSCGGVSTRSETENSNDKGCGGEDFNNTSRALVHGRPLWTYSSGLQRVVILLQRVVETLSNY